VNVKKFPEADPLFHQKVMGACQNDFERGLVIILRATGMHLSCLTSLTPKQMDMKGRISWHRPKTGRPMRATIPKGDRDLARDWIETFGGEGSTRSDRWVQYVIKDIGARAGFPDLSPMSFRVQRGCDLLDEGEPPHRVAHLLGCKLSTLEEHYAVLRADRKADGDDR
jgi:hypothetical protein